MAFFNPKFFVYFSNYFLQNFTLYIFLVYNVKKVTLNIMKNFYEYLYFTIYKVIYIIYLYFYRCKIVELLFRVLRRFATLLNDLSLVLSFLSSFSAFMCVLKAYFVATSKVRPRPDGTNSCHC